MSFAVYYFEGAIRVASGDAAVAALSQRVQGALLSGEASGFVVNAANGAAPIVGAWNDTNFVADVSTAWAAMDINSVARETLAAIMGTLAGLYALPSGPANALVADTFASAAFKNAYDKVTAASQALLPWTEIFDGIDDIITWHKIPSQQRKNPLFDPNLIDPNTLLPIDPATNARTMDSVNWVPPRRDPLVLDLDGSGITTSGINPAAPILFDQDGDGTKTATGWIAAGEAIVVRDLNGNGTIDNGRELFGDNTILTRGARAGQVAANGFEALADLDSNADGKFDAADAAFASVKLWRDLDQDGISQSSELFTFAQLGVASINVSGTTSDVNLGGGNTQTQTGSFTKTDNTAGSAGTAHLAGSLLLANNNFYREFSDDPALSAEAQALPQMQGSGTVRDLRPAMSLGTPQAAALQTALTQYAADTTRAQQLGHLDGLIQSWGATSTMPTSVQTNRTIANYGGPNLIDTYGATAIEVFALTSSAMYAKITALEQFNGQTILDKWVRTTGLLGSLATARVIFSDQQADFINQAYDALKGSVYGALVTQTRLKPYLDSIGLVIDESGVRFDTTARPARYTFPRLKPTPANGGSTKGGMHMQFNNEVVAIKLIACCASSTSATDLFSTGSPLATARPRIKLQQLCRWQAQGLRQTADIDQGNIALPTLHTTQIAAGQTTVQSQALLRHALCPAQRRHMLPKTHHGVVGQRRERDLNRRMGGFGSGEFDGLFGHRLSVKTSPLSGYAL
jgi:hypothetical protein